MTKPIKPDVKPIKHDVKEIEQRDQNFRYICTCGAKGRSWVGTIDEARVLHTLHDKEPHNGTFIENLVTFVL